MTGRKISEELVHIVPDADTRFAVAKDLGGGTWEGGYVTFSEVGGVADYSLYYGVDLTDETYVYGGYKKASTDDWRIKRVQRSNYEVKWAVGSTGGQAAWDDRYNQSYGDL